MKKGRCVIVGGADISHYACIAREICRDDYVIYCDSGLNHRQELEREPDLIVGDFDSCINPHLEVETIILPCEKDDTDTVFAVKEAIRRGFRDFLLIGVVGKRMDHTLGNISILLYLDSLGLQGTILDDYGKMRIVSKEPVYVADKCAFFSLLNISGTASGISIENAKYPLNDATIACEYQYGVSNEVLPGKMAKIVVTNGKLLLIEIYKCEP